MPLSAKSRPKDSKPITIDDIQLNSICKKTLNNADTHFETDFLKSDDSNSEMLTFLDNLKKIACDHTSITKYLPPYCIHESFETATEEAIVELYHNVKVTKSIPPFLRDIHETSYADAKMIPRAIDLEKENCDAKKNDDDNNTCTIENNKDIVNFCQDICQDIFKLSTEFKEKYKNVLVQTELSTKHVEALLQWAKNTPALSNGSITNIIEDWPKVIFIYFNFVYVRVVTID